MSRTSVVVSSSFEALEPRVLLSSDPNNTLVLFETSYGNVVMEMYDTLAPVTVTNFLTYITDGDFDGSVLHRSVSNFVLQGGGFYWDGSAVTEVPEDSSIVNEPDPVNRPNVARTIAMAKLGGAPDSATNQFFWNLKDNATLDDTSRAEGAFSVFGHVVGGWDVVERIASLRIVNLSSLVMDSAFGETPVTGRYVGGTVPAANELVKISQATIIGTVGNLLDAVPGTLISADAIDTGAASAALPNSDGSQTVFQYDPDSGEWVVSALALEAQKPEGPSIETFIDPKNGLTYGAVATPNGVLLYRNSDRTNGDWDVRNLSAEAGSTETLSGSLTSFMDPLSEKMYLGALNAAGDLILFFQTGQIDNRGFYRWESRNVAQVDLAANGLTMPALTGVLSSYTAPWGGLNIAGLDADGDLHSLWFAPGLSDGYWRTANLTTITGAPELAGRVTPWVTSWGAINLVGTTLDGSVVATWWLPQFGNAWRQSDLTALVGGPRVVINSIDSYFKDWGGQNIAGVDQATGKVVVYWWAPGIINGEWQVANLSNIIAGSDLPYANVSVGSVPGGDTHIFATNTDGDVVRYSWDFGSNLWDFQNLTEDANLV